MYSHMHTHPVMFHRHTNTRSIKTLTLRHVTSSLVHLATFSHLKTRTNLQASERQGEQFVVLLSTQNSVECINHFSHLKELVPCLHKHTLKKIDSKKNYCRAMELKMVSGPNWSWVIYEAAVHFMSLRSTSASLFSSAQMTASASVSLTFGPYILGRLQARI